MKLKNSFTIAINAILINKVRSFLTMLGIIIGVSSVVMLTSLGQGLSNHISEQFEKLGSNNISIFPGDAFDQEGGFNRDAMSTAIANSKLKLSDATEINKLTSFVEAAVPATNNADTLSFQKKTKRITVVGVTYNYNQVINFDTDKGRFLSKSEDSKAEKTAVIGYEVAEKVFGQVDPIGKTIKIGNQSFKVIGVAEKLGSGFGGPSFDTYVYIPIERAFKLYDTNTVVEIVAKAKNKEKMDETIAAIEEVMLKRLDDEDFSIFEQTDILDMINEILGVMTVGLGGIAAISLLVGGIGIMNIMLVSVTERTQEIGLRKAVGATPSQILLQFLIESLVLSVSGGLIGLSLAFLGAMAIQEYFPAKVTLQAVLLAFFVSMAVGVVFGAAPARRASKLSPIEALTYEH